MDTSEYEILDLIFFVSVNSGFWFLLLILFNSYNVVNAVFSFLSSRMFSYRVCDSK